MLKSISARLAILSIVALATLPAFAKDSSALQAASDAKAAASAATRAVAASKSANSVEAQVEGNAGRAAKAARDAAIQQKAADKLDEKSADLQVKADKKANKESR